MREFHRARTYNAVMIETAGNPLSQIFQGVNQRSAL